MVASRLPDGDYDALVVDVHEAGDAHDDDRDGGRVELVVTSGEHKGEVVALRTRQPVDPVDLLGVPAVLHVRDGVPSVSFER